MTVRSDHKRYAGRKANCLRSGRLLAGAGAFLMIAFGPSACLRLEQQPPLPCEEQFDLSSDRNNCGTCGNVCWSYTECRNGACECLEGMVRCGTSCLDLLSDENNCGECTRSCPTDSTCQDGDCVCNHDQCGSDCVDFATDVKNCGACGKTCADGDQCKDGKCWRCVGTATPCYDRTSQECSAGCQMGGGCTGGAFKCSVFDHSCDSCERKVGCSCNSLGHCVGTGICEEQGPMDCNEYAGCSQGTGCRGTATPCDALPDGVCDAVPGCTVKWIP